MTQLPAATLSTTNPHPVDSATRPCCGGIGSHTRDCLDLRTVPHPAGATEVGDWYDAHTESPGRYFTGAPRELQDGRGTVVLIAGTQHPDGSHYRLILLSEGGCERICELTAGQPSQSENPATSPPGHSSGGFANAETRYANPDSTGGVNSGNSHVVSQYDVAGFQWALHHPAG